MTRGKGVQKSDNFADVIKVWHLTQILTCFSKTLYVDYRIQIIHQKYVLPYTPTYHVGVIGGILLVDLPRPAEVEPDVAVVAGLFLRRGPDPVQPSQEVPRLNHLSKTQSAISVCEQKTCLVYRVSMVVRE